MTHTELIKALGGQTRLARLINEYKNKEAQTKGVFYLKRGAVDQWSYSGVIPKAYRTVIAKIVRTKKPYIQLPENFLN